MNHKAKIISAAFLALLGLGLEVCAAVPKIRFNPENPVVSLGRSSTVNIIVTDSDGDLESLTVESNRFTTSILEIKSQTADKIKATLTFIPTPSRIAKCFDEEIELSETEQAACNRFISRLTSYFEGSGVNIFAPSGQVLSNDGGNVSVIEEISNRRQSARSVSLIASDSSRSIRERIRFEIEQAQEEQEEENAEEDTESSRRFRASNPLSNTDPSEIAQRATAGVEAVNNQAENIINAAVNRRRVKHISPENYNRRNISVLADTGLSATIVPNEASNPGSNSNKNSANNSENNSTNTSENSENDSNNNSAVASVNVAPSLDFENFHVIAAGAQSSILVNAQDPNLLDQMRLSPLLFPKDLEFSVRSRRAGSRSGNLSWTPMEEGVFSVVLESTDGTASTIKDMTLVVVDEIKASEASFSISNTDANSNLLISPSNDISYYEVSKLKGRKSSFDLNISNNNDEAIELKLEVPEELEGLVSFPETISLGRNASRELEIELPGRNQYRKLSKDNPALNPYTDSMVIPLIISELVNTEGAATGGPGTIAANESGSTTNPGEEAAQAQDNSATIFLKINP